MARPILLQPRHDYGVSIRSTPPPIGIALVAAAFMTAGALGPWVVSKLSGSYTGVALGGDGWLLVVAATAVVVPLVLGFGGGVIAVWAITNAAAGGYVCLVHYQHTTTDGLQNGWGLTIASVGCALLAVAGIKLLRTPQTRRGTL